MNSRRKSFSYLATMKKIGGSLLTSRGVFRNKSNIHDRAFLRKKPLTIFTKKLHQKVRAVEKKDCCVKKDEKTPQPANAVMSRLIVQWYYH